MAAMAGTDVTAQLAYQQRIRAYHTRLRGFYYGFLFGEARFEIGESVSDFLRQLKT